MRLPRHDDDPRRPPAPRGHVLLGLGAVASHCGRLDDAERMLGEALEIYSRTLGEDHPALVPVLINLASVSHDRADLAGAERQLRRALAIQRRTVEGDHPALAETLGNLALVLYARGDAPGAEAAYREALDVLERASLADHPAVAQMRQNHADTLRLMGRMDEAEREARAAVALRRAGARPGELAASLDILAAVLADAKRPAEAEPLLRESLDLRRAKAPETLARSATPSLLGAALLDLGRLDEAEPLLQGSLAELEREPGVPGSQLAAARERLARLRDAQGRPDEADALRKR